MNVTPKELTAGGQWHVSEHHVKDLHYAAAAVRACAAAGLDTDQLDAGILKDALATIRSSEGFLLSDDDSCLALAMHCRAILHRLDHPTPENP